MKSRKFYVIIVAVVFFVTLLLSLFFLFNVKEMRTQYVVYDNMETAPIYESLQAFKGKNILFISEEEVVNSVKAYSRFKVNKVEKHFPNVMSVEIEERKEVYRLVAGDKSYGLDETGYILGTFDIDVVPKRDIITLKFDGLTISSSDVGGFLKTNDDELLLSVLSMASDAKLFNCIQNINIILGEKGSDVKDAIFETYTGVAIRITEANVKSKEKIEKAFYCYDTEISDFHKTFGLITVVELIKTGEIRATWDKRA